MGQVGASLSSQTYPVFWQCFWKRPWFHRATLLHSSAFLSSRAVSSKSRPLGVEACLSPGLSSRLVNIKWEAYLVLLGYQLLLS